MDLDVSGAIAVFDISKGFPNNVSGSFEKTFLSDVSFSFLEGIDGIILGSI